MSRPFPSAPLSCRGVRRLPVRRRLTLGQAALAGRHVSSLAATWMKSSAKAQCKPRRLPAAVQTRWAHGNVDTASKYADLVRSKVDRSVLSLPLQLPFAECLLQPQSHDLFQVVLPILCEGEDSIMYVKSPRKHCYQKSPSFLWKQRCVGVI
eukprot:483090-Hanusia_phi.AAC.4